MIAMVVGECINFPIQRSFVFRSKGNIWYQGMWYLIAFCIVTCIVNSINCIWVAVAGMFVPDWLYNIGTTVLNGGVSMVVFFFVNKIIFPEGEAKKRKLKIYGAAVLRNWYAALLCRFYFDCGCCFCCVSSKINKNLFVS